MNDDLTQYFIPQIERSGLSSGRLIYVMERPNSLAYSWNFSDIAFTKNEKNFGLDQFNEEFGEKYIFMEYVGTEKDFPRFVLKGGPTHKHYSNK